MGRPCWATDDEREWLQSKVPDFRKAQQKRNLHNFYQETAQAFYQAFPSAMLSFRADAASRARVDPNGAEMELTWKAALDVRLPYFS